MHPIEINDLQRLPSPCLVVDATRVHDNIQQMIHIAGSAERLRPHLKTHKMREVVQLQLQAGITRFKAATPVEVQMACEAGAADVLLAHQPVGPKIDALATLRQRYPRVRISTLVDDREVLRVISARVGSTSRPIPVWIDVDCGMGRTGIGFGAELERLHQAIDSDDRCTFAGLHVYDGHIHDSALEVRADRVRPVLRAVREYAQGCGVPAIAIGGTPTFGLWAQQTDWECCPGTSLLWDVGYARNYAELPFRIAAALVTRVVSKPGRGRLCLDLGYKAVASEMPLADRVEFPTLAAVELVGHSEEHLVISTFSAGELQIGEAVVAYPRHICPTVALYEEALVVRDGQEADERWPVVARGRSMR
jgi:D-serine deaminase-like pyridoxal phosphate-dependent protein